MRKNLQQIIHSKQITNKTSTRCAQQSSRKTASKEEAPFKQIEATLQSLPQSLVSCDREGKILWMNTAALTLFEISTPDKYQNTSYEQFLQCYAPHDLQQSASPSEQWLMDLLLEKKMPSEASETILRLHQTDEHTIYVVHWCLPVPDTDTTIYVFQDITNQYQKVQHLQHVYEAIMTLTEAIARIPEQIDHMEPGEFPLLSPAVLLVVQPLVDVIWHVLDCRRVVLLAYQPGGHFHYVASKGLTPGQKQLHRAKGWSEMSTEYVSRHILTQLAANQEVVLPVQFLRKALRFPVGMDGESILVVPLFLEQQRVGSLSIIKKDSQPGYTEKEVELVKAVAGQVMLLIAYICYLQEWDQNGRQARILQEVNRLSNDFLTLASHELRTPLTGIKGNLQLAQHRLERMKHQFAEQSKPVDKHITQVQQPLSSASESIWLQERMLQNLIDDACLQTNELELSLHPCNLLSLTQQAVLRQQQLNPKSTIMLEIKPQLWEIPVLADAGRINRVLDTYLGNALGSSTAENPVTVMVTVEDAIVRVSVHNEGPGIPLEEQTHLWKRFYRAKGSAIQHELDLSFGLGLYLCQAFIERHQGSVGIQSAPGQGATFWFTLPIRPGKEAGL